MAVLLDTTCFVALERKGLSLSALGEVLPDSSVALSSVTASEMLVGVHMANTKARMTRRSAFVEAILETLPIIAFDLACSRIHARLRAMLRAEGTTIGAHDLLIASTSLAHGLDVATDNLRDFKRVPGLNVLHLDWSRLDIG